MPTALTDSVSADLQMRKFEGERHFPTALTGMIPSVSIITVVFNGARTLRATMDSVVQQLNDEIEYIVIDGDSTDGTQDIIAEYASHLAYWVSEPDSGIYDAWNKGLAHASGQYIGFVGADDILLPDAISTYLHHIRQQPEIEYWSSKVVFGHMSGRVIGQPWHWDTFRRYMTVAHVGSLHSRDLYDRFGIYDTSYRIVGDYEFLLRAGAPLKAGFVDQVTVMMGDGGVSNKFVLQALEETARAKREKNATSIAVTNFDYCIARFKQAARSWIKKIA